jgi:hypothetical protein
MSTIHSREPERTLGADPFLTPVEEAAARYLRVVPDLTPEERDFLRNVGRSLYGFKAVRRLLEIAARAETPGQSAAFASAMRGYTMRVRSTVRRDTECDVTALHFETRAQALGDVSQTAAVVNPSRVNRESVIQHTTEHVEWALRLIDAHQQRLYQPRPLILVP